MKKILVFMVCLFSMTAGYGQDTMSKAAAPLISGYAGVYYKYNFNENATDNKTSFTRSQNSFELGMLSVKIQHDFGKVSFTGDLGFGKRAEEFSYNDKGTSAAIKQLYIDYTPLPWLKLTAGSFATYIGYESVDANVNKNYSMSYLFTYGPFFHTGLKAEVSVGDHTFMLGVFNATDYKYAPPGSKKYIGAQWKLAREGSPFSLLLNYLGGTDTAGVRSDQADLVITYRLNKHFNMAYDGSYCRYGGNVPAADWWGSDLYLNAVLSETFSLTLRTEYFNDGYNLRVFTDKERFAGGGNIWSFTLSGNYKLKALMLIPEIRLDRASSPLFTRKGKSVSASPSALVAAVYSF
jgi:hypothetical protein